MNAKLMQGMLDLLILEVVGENKTYGYAITQTVIQRSEGQLELKEGSLYPALHRLEQQKLLSAHWQEADGRRRKYYRLTAAGKKTLEAKKREWESFVRGVSGVLGGADAMA